MLTKEIVKDILDRFQTMRWRKYANWWFENPQNRVRFEETQKIWREQNPQRIAMHQKRYQDKPIAREKASVRGHRRRALELGCEGSHTAQEWLNKKLAYGNCCAYCGKETESLTKDLVMPLSQGGSNNIDNIVPACNFCNSSKHNKIIQT